MAITGDFLEYAGVFYGDWTAKLVRPETFTVPTFRAKERVRSYPPRDLQKAHNAVPASCVAPITSIIPTTPATQPARRPKRSIGRCAALAAWPKMQGR